MTGRWKAWAAEQLDVVRAAGRWRAPRDLDAAGPTGQLTDGRAVVSFASNDYLGLSQHPAVVAAAHAALDRWGAGAGAARLVVGSRPSHTQLEDQLAAWKGTDGAVLFPTGYVANIGVLTTMGRTGTLIVSDELNHASIHDGCRLARAKTATFRHADTDHVASLLSAHDGPVVVVTDLVFSMDGDLAPVTELSRLCAEHDALLVLDEAHGILAGEPELGDAEVIRVGTLSKTFGSLGGFAAGAQPLVDLLVNRARTYIFTTASTPADVAAAAAALGVLRSQEGSRLVTRLRRAVDRLAPGRPSPIVPIVVGSAQEAVATADALLERGLLVPAIRPPTVPVGTSRLRLTVSALHTDEQLDALVEGLDAVVPDWRGVISG